MFSGRICFPFISLIFPKRYFLYSKSDISPLSNGSAFAHVNIARSFLNIDRWTRPAPSEGTHRDLYHVDAYHENTCAAHRYMRPKTSRICHVLHWFPQPVCCAVCTPSLPYYRYCRVAQEARQMSSDAVYGRLQWHVLQSAVSTKTDVSYEALPLTSLSLRFYCCLGVEITSVRWHVCAVFFVCYFGVGIRMKATG